MDERKIVDLPIDDVLPNRFQPRIKFDDNSIFELSESIKAHGVFQPIIVRKIGDKYEIIAGERRYKASVLANKTTVPAIIMDLNDKDTVEVALVENVQRSNLTPIEEAISYKKILDMGYMNQEQLAEKLGKSQSSIANKLRLLNLDEDVQTALLENKISERHARSLLRLKDIDDQKLMLMRIINEKLTVRKTDEEINMMNNENNQMYDGPILINDQINNNSINKSSDNDDINSQSNNFFSGNEDSFKQDNTNIFNSFNPIENNNNGVFDDVNNFNTQSNFNNSSVINSNDRNIAQSVAPSVMDLNKIQENASNFIPEEKKVAPIADLLRSNGSVEAMKSNDKVEDDTMNSLNSDNNSVDNSVRPGRFFNIFDSPSSNNVNDNVASNNTDNSNSFNYNSLYDGINNNSISENNDTNANNNVNYNSSDSSKNDFDIFNRLNGNSDPFDSKSDSNKLNSNVEETINPINNGVNMNGNDFFNIGNNDMGNNSSAISTTFDNAINNDSNIDNWNKEIDVDDNSSISNNINLDEKIVDNNDDSVNSNNNIVDNNIDNTNFINPFNSSLSSDSSSKVSGDNEILDFDDVVSNNTMNLSSNSDIIKSDVDKNINTAIDIVRDAIQKIKNLGFSVDSDEIDLESLYQIIVKIDK